MPPRISRALFCSTLVRKAFAVEASCECRQIKLQIASIANKIFSDLVVGYVGEEKVLVWPVLVLIEGTA